MVEVRSSLVVKWLIIVVLAGCIHRTLPPQLFVTGTLPNGVRYAVQHQDFEEKEVVLGIAAGDLQDQDDAAGAAWTLASQLATEPYAARVEADITTIGSSASEGSFYNIHTVAEVGGQLDDLRRMIDMPLAQMKPVRTLPLENFSSDTVVTWLGTRLILHWPLGVKEGISLTDLERYRTRWYVASEIVVYVTGPWPLEDVVREIQRSFGDVPARPVPTTPALAVAGGVTEASASTPTRDRMVAIRIPAPIPSSPAKLRTAVARWLFVRALNARLYRMALRDGKPPENGAWHSVRARRLSRDVASLQITGAVLADLERDVEIVRTSPFSPEDLAKARAVDLHISSGEMIDSPALGGELCYGPVPRLVLGFMFPHCESEDVEWRRLIPLITDAEIDGLRSLLDLRIATRLR